MSDDALRILQAVGNGARLWVGPNAHDVTASVQRVFRREVRRPGVDLAAVASRVMERVIRTEGRTRS